MSEDIKNINLDTATIEELKVAAFDNLRRMETLQRQQQILSSAIDMKERTLLKEKMPEVEEVKTGKGGK